MLYDIYVHIRSVNLYSFLIMHCDMKNDYEKKSAKMLTKAMKINCLLIVKN